MEWLTFVIPPSWELAAFPLPNSGEFSAITNFGITNFGMTNFGMKNFGITKFSRKGRERSREFQLDQEWLSEMWGQFYTSAAVWEAQLGHS